MTTVETIDIDNVTIDMIKNDLLSNKPFLIRLSGFDGVWNFPETFEFRADKNELLTIAQSILNFVEKT